MKSSQWFIRESWSADDCLWDRGNKTPSLLNLSSPILSDPCQTLYQDSVLGGKYLTRNWETQFRFSWPPTCLSTSFYLQIVGAFSKNYFFILWPEDCSFYEGTFTVLKGRRDFHKTYSFLCSVSTQKRADSGSDVLNMCDSAIHRKDHRKPKEERHPRLWVHTWL